MPQPRSERREQILQTLVVMLEENASSKITTARLAERVGVSEAALYRHFASKTKMFEALIEFAEDTLFTRVRQISEEGSSALIACERMLALFLGFCERNPGIARILHGEALANEEPRLHLRVSQIYDRLETQLRTTLRQAENHESLRPQLVLNDAATLLMATAEGRLSQFIRSQFKRSPLTGWPEQWAVLTGGFMREVPTQ
ncbi:MAG: nucleoid occlusion factor SlmA [Luminiphilus sp.]|nr:nucleoid occlusion factor SlmA [Luminiphilus sp.]MDA0630732.1 nucleoid occlusion factor SlmA [Pseudomonadota bacterium]